MNKSAAVYAQIEPQTKEKAEDVLRKIGMSPAEAIRLFYAQICLRGKLPFPVPVPNKLTEKTLDKSAQGEDVQFFGSLDEMFESWEE